MAKGTILKARNNTGATIPAGSAVYTAGFDTINNVFLIALASCDDSAKMPAVGIVPVDLPSDGTAISIKITGLVSGYNTFGLAPNTGVYVGLNGAINFYNPNIVNQSYIGQQLGTVSYSALPPAGAIELFPLEVRNRLHHVELLDVLPDQHHSQIHASSHSVSGGDTITHGNLGGLGNDDHTQYSKADGTRDFSGAVKGIDGADPADLTTKNYVDIHDCTVVMKQASINLTESGSSSPLTYAIVGSGAGSLNAGIVIVPAVTGKILIPAFWTLNYTFDTASYGKGGDITLQYDSVDISSALSKANSFGSSNSGYRFITPLQYSAAMLTGKALKIISATDFSQNGAHGTGTITVYYYEIS